MVFAALKSGTAAYAQSVAMADVLQRELGTVFSVSPTPGNGPICDLLKRGEAEIAIVSGPVLTYAWLGGKGWEEIAEEFVSLGPVPIRMLVSGQLLGQGVIVHGDSDIHSMQDLKGKKVFTDNPASPGNLAIFKAHLAANGVNLDDVTVLTMSSSSKGMQSVIEGAGDAVVCSTGGSKMLDFNEKCDGYVLSTPIDSESMKIYRTYVPGVVPLVEEEARPGVEAGTTNFAMILNLVTTKECSDEVAYTITKTVLENVEELGTLHKNFKTWGLNTAVVDQSILYHPGAVKYYQEKGVWTSEMAELQKEISNKGP
ncbi:TAXI family TRAP transporter solute-binding subunit [Chloroflexota bacterium]